MEAVLPVKVGRFCFLIGNIVQCIVMLVIFALMMTTRDMEGQYELPLDVAAKGPAEVRRRRIMRPLDASSGLTSRRLRVNDRNRVLIARYYYWTEIRRRRFDDVMRILSTEEFFVEDRTISNALLDYGDYLDELYRTRKEPRELKKEYPSWCWD